MRWFTRMTTKALERASAELGEQMQEDLAAEVRWPTLRRFEC